MVAVAHVDAEGVGAGAVQLRRSSRACCSPGRAWRARAPCAERGDDIKDVMSEMKGRGYDTKIVRKLISIRKKKKGEHEEEAMVLETYMAALGMI
jgi:uncharacterized protein (UPF0335 family)